MNYPSIPRLGNQAIHVSQQPLVMREGQMFHGQIKQLFPGQMAEVQIGGQKLMAKLEVPMKAGDAYYFQVKSVAPELQIKVISGPLQSAEGQAKQMANLMDSMQLPKSPEMVTVLSHFLKERLPVSKETLLNAVNLMKAVQPTSYNEALSSIQKLVELKLPLNEVNFKSLTGVQMKEGMHDVLSALRNALVKDESMPAQSKEKLLASIGETSRTTFAAAERTLVSMAMAKLLDETAPREDRFQVLQLLKGANILPSSMTLANLRSMVDLSVVEQSAGGNLKNLIQHDPVLQQPLKIQLMSLVSELEDNRASDMRNSPVTEQISKMIMRAGAEQVQTTPLRMDNPSVATKLLLPEEAQARIPELFRAMEQSPVPIARELVQGAKAIVEQAIDGKVMKEIMQGLFKSLGFNYEAGLLNGNQEITRMMDMLKPQLVALLHDSAISPALRDAVETVIARMNGTLLHSSDTGLNQQIVIQLPLEFLGKRIDATIQWNGRKKEDGKIDADFARILFYLDLESLNKTIVDMQVQNRVVTLTIFNENHEVREIGNMLQTKLREGLETVDYRLSGVSFKNIEEEEIGDSKRRNELMTDHGGVDFRI